MPSAAAPPGPAPVTGTVPTPAAPGSATPAPAVPVVPPAPHDNSPLRQVIVIIEHKIRNLEKRKSKLISYRDLQKSGKELNADQKVAVAKYDEVTQTLEFARDMAKQVATIALVAERDAKKQAKKEAFFRTATETAKIRDVLLILDCLVQMGHAPAREDFLRGANGAAQLTDEDLRILDDLYPEVTPKHELNEEGAPTFAAQAMKAAEHLYSIIDGKTKEMLGTTYTHIKQIVSSVHECGYFDKSGEMTEAEVQEEQVTEATEEVEERVEPPEVAQAPSVVYVPQPLPLPEHVPVPPAAAVVPPPAYPLRPLPPITLQEVEHAYFTQQYAQQRPITEVIGSQNFFFLQESEIDSPVGTPQPPPIMAKASPPGPIPTQTFTNQNFIPIAGARVAPEPAILPPQPLFAQAGEHPPYVQAPLPPRSVPQPNAEQSLPPPPAQQPEPSPTAEEPPMAAATIEDWNESPERDDDEDKLKVQGEGDGQGQRYRRYGRGAPRGPRESNGFRGGGRGGYRQNNDSYQGGRQNNGGYQGRPNDNYQGRPERQSDGYYRNGDNGNNRNDNGRGRDRYDNGGDRYDNSQGYQGGYKGRGRGGVGSRGTRPGGPGGPPRSDRPPSQYPRKQCQNAE